MTWKTDELEALYAYVQTQVKQRLPFEILNHVMFTQLMDGAIYMIEKTDGKITGAFGFVRTYNMEPPLIRWQVLFAYGDCARSMQQFIHRVEGTVECAAHAHNTKLDAYLKKHKFKVHTTVYTKEYV